MSSMRKWITKHYDDIKVAAVLGSTVLLMIWGAYEFVFKSPDENRVEIHCLFGNEYLYFSSGYKAGLAARWNDDGTLIKCDD